MTPLELIERVLNLADAVRDRVNRRRRHRALMRDAEAYNTTCSAMDTVSDTCQALRPYFE
jgi:hypothetical protein